MDADAWRAGVKHELLTPEGLEEVKEWWSDWPLRATEHIVASKAREDIPRLLATVEAYRKRNVVLRDRARALGWTGG